MVLKSKDSKSIIAVCNCICDCGQSIFFSVRKDWWKSAGVYATVKNMLPATSHDTNGTLRNTKENFGNAFDILTGHELYKNGVCIDQADLDEIRAWAKEAMDEAYDCAEVPESESVIPIFTDGEFVFPNGDELNLGFLDFSEDEEESDDYEINIFVDKGYSVKDTFEKMSKELKPTKYVPSIELSRTSFIRMCEWILDNWKHVQKVEPKEEPSEE